MTNDSRNDKHTNFYVAAAADTGTGEQAPRPDQSHPTADGSARAGTRELAKAGQGSQSESPASIPKRSRRFSMKAEERRLRKAANAHEKAHGCSGWANERDAVGNRCLLFCEIRTSLTHAWVMAYDAERVATLFDGIRSAVRS